MNALSMDYSVVTSKLPIDTKEKAIIESKRILKFTSCLSTEGFTNSIHEMKAYWVVVSEDKNRLNCCGVNTVNICKGSGVINEQCT